MFRDLLGVRDSLVVLWKVVVDCLFLFHLRYFSPLFLFLICRFHVGCLFFSLLSFPLIVSLLSSSFSCSQKYLFSLSSSFPSFPLFHLRLRPPFIHSLSFFLFVLMFFFLFVVLALLLFRPLPSLSHDHYLPSPALPLLEKNRLLVQILFPFTLYHLPDTLPDIT